MDLAREIEVIPADDTVLDEPVAAFRNLLLFFFRLREFTGAANSDGARKFIDQLDLVELLFNRLPQLYIIDITQDEIGFDDLAESFERLVKRVLTGVRIEASKNIRGGAFLEFDGGNQPL